VARIGGAYDTAASTFMAVTKMSRQRHTIAFWNRERTGQGQLRFCGVPGAARQNCGRRRAADL